MRRLLARLALGLLALLAFAGFVALGTWQLERRAWKLELIDRIDQRVHAPPVEAPGPQRWPHINAADDEYRHVRASGTFLHAHETLVQASTELGGGYWVLTPLQLADGSLLLVNRGFVTPQQRTPESRGVVEATGPVTVTGLLRLSEPKGALLRDNDPAANRWYSRDVQAIAAARGLERVAPYFVDADAAAAGERQRPPVGGLTVIAFPNNHLGYALTWYALALMVLGAAWFVVRDQRRRNDDGGTDGAAA
ncbi:SURF1 family protein [Variovorax sp. J22P168]|uniref:SURF1 family protein n=1 Tax=Variovorax jilinensis TaxID=3053513 RepID=UPI0025760CB9|nr:SURF1 family protein [Variovorax sp. J22P168]MDM0012810.1 SURF1 family protein [Variovorax sp. J22P168]